MEKMVAGNKRLTNLATSFVARFGGIFGRQVAA
jgi:hypothetical protein